MVSLAVWRVLTRLPDFSILGVEPMPFALEAFVVPAHGMLMWWRVPIPLATDALWITGLVTWN